MFGDMCQRWGVSDWFWYRRLTGRWRIIVFCWMRERDDELDGFCKLDVKVLGIVHKVYQVS